MLVAILDLASRWPQTSFNSIDSITLANSVYVFHSLNIQHIDQPRCFVLFSITNFNVQKILLSLSIHFAYFCRISAVEVIYLGHVHYFSVYVCVLGCWGGGGGGGGGVLGGGGGVLGGGGGGCWCRHNSALLGKVYFKFLFTNYENIFIYHSALVTSGNSGLPRPKSSRKSSSQPSHQCGENMGSPSLLSFEKKCDTGVTTSSPMDVYRMHVQYKLLHHGYLTDLMGQQPMSSGFLSTRLVFIVTLQICRDYTCRLQENVLADATVSALRPVAPFTNMVKLQSQHG